jgi:hypothetical protein
VFRNSFFAGQSLSIGEHLSPQKMNF